MKGATPPAMMETKMAGRRRKKKCARERQEKRRRIEGLRGGCSLSNEVEGMGFAEMIDLTSGSVVVVYTEICRESSKS